MSEPFDPVRAAQAKMRAPEIKRFYTTAAVAETPAGFALQLDGRSARTPGKRPLVAPTRAIAELIAAEWAAQGQLIEPATMPATRLANSALDGVAGATAETRAEILRYFRSDLVCYRADAPVELVALQSQAHDPVLSWALEALGARFATGQGLLFVEQPRDALAACEAALSRFQGPFAIAALHSLTSLSGSALLALMVARGAISPEDAWRASHVDEDYQISKWGEDDEAVGRRQARWREFQAAARIMAAL
jgi:chaperone required for assembly of F1-ATPase